MLTPRDRGHRGPPRLSLSNSECPTGTKPVLFLDFEASSLDPGSWPVEIGWACIAEGVVEVRSEIVAPRASWCPSAWSESAALCHGLTLEGIRAGRPADLVAAETDRFADYLVVSDNPRWDQVWLDRLREGRQRIVVHGVRQAVATRLTGREADAFSLALFRTKAPHRAGADAARLASAWLGASESLPSPHREAAAARVIRDPRD